MGRIKSVILRYGLPLFPAVVAYVLVGFVAAAIVYTLVGLSPTYWRQFISWRNLDGGHLVASNGAPPSGSPLRLVAIAVGWIVLTVLGSGIIAGLGIGLAKGFARAVWHVEAIPTDRATLNEIGLVLVEVALLVVFLQARSHRWEWRYACGPRRWAGVECADHRVLGAADRGVRDRPAVRLWPGAFTAAFTRQLAGFALLHRRGRFGSILRGALLSRLAVDRAAEILGSRGDRVGIKQYVAGAPCSAEQRLVSDFAYSGRDHPFDRTA
jgi:hypothetical protein